MLFTMIERVRIFVTYMGVFFRRVRMVYLDWNVDYDTERMLNT